jgi:hypothetical protein
VWIVIYRDGDDGLLHSFVTSTIEDLDSSISGIEMDNGHVRFVLDEDGNKVTPEQIGSRQIQAW